MSYGGGVDLDEVARRAGERKGTIWLLGYGGDLNANLVRFPAGRGVGEHVNDEGIDLQTGFVHELRVPTPYDAATLLLVMHFLPDDGQKLDLLRSISARIKPGAPFVLADMHGDKASGQFADFIAAWKHRQLALGVPEDTVQERLRHTLSSLSFVPEERILKLLGEAGFGNVEPFYRALLLGGWVAQRAT